MGPAYIGNNPYGIFLPAISQYSFLFGPQYRVYMKPKWAVSVQALAGFGHGNFDTGTGGLPASYLGLYNNGTVFNLSLGAPLDYNLSPGLAIRVTPLYLLTFVWRRRAEQPGLQCRGGLSVGQAVESGK